MKHLFIPYELAVIAKEKGFNEPCFALHKHEEGDINLEIESCSADSIGKQDYLAPLYQQIVDWFRDKHDLIIFIAPFPEFDNATVYNWCIYNKKLGNKTNNYYEALNKAIEEAFNMIEGISNLPHNEEASKLI